MVDQIRGCSAERLHSRRCSMALIASRATSFRPCVSDVAEAADRRDAEAIRCYQKPGGSKMSCDLLPTLLKKTDGLGNTEDLREAGIAR